MEVMNTFNDAAPILISALTFGLSAWAIIRSSRISRDARREWVDRWDGDTEVLAVIMARHGWWERKRLTRELARRG